MVLISKSINKYNQLRNLLCDQKITVNSFRGGYTIHQMLSLYVFTIWLRILFQHVLTIEYISLCHLQ